MRVNQKNVINAHFNGKAHTEATISTDGRTIKSYATPLLYTDKTTGRLTFNATKYSPTTSGQQSSILQALSERGLVYDTVDNMPRGFYVD